MNELDPWNPPEVASSLTELGCDVLAVAEFMGYKHEELPLQQGPERKPILPVPNFLTVWKIPDCGRRTPVILHSVKRMTGFITEECEWSCNMSTCAHEIVCIVYS